MSSWDPKDFPRLNDTNSRVTSPKSQGYNCVAWAAGFDGKWWDPTEPGYWPEGVARVLTLQAFEQAFATLGFEPCSGHAHGPEFDVIAIYARIDAASNNFVPTHAARLLPSGRWTSKLGALEDIEHDAPEDVCGPSYGHSVRYLRRLKIPEKS